MTALSIGLADLSHSAAVGKIDKSTVAQHINLQLRDTTKLLAPARAAFDRGDLEKARELLIETTANSGYLPHHEVQLALWLFNAGRQQDGVRTMEKVAMENPDRPDVRYLFAEIARSRGRYFDAWTHASVGQETKPPERWKKDYVQHMEYLLMLCKAQTADARGDWRNSLALFERLRRTGRSNVKTDVAMARASFHLGFIDEAEAFFRTAAKRENATLVPELAMATLYNAKGDLKSTEAWFKRYGEAAADKADVIRLEYVRWLLRQNRHQDARKVASVQRPQEKMVRDFEYMIAMCARMEGDFSMTASILERLLKNNEGNFQVANQLALALIENEDEGQRARALLLASRNLKASPRSKDAVSTYAWVQHRLGDSLEAEKLFNAILRGGQASRDTAYYVSEVKKSLNKVKESELLLNAALDSDGEFFNAFRAKAPSTQPQPKSSSESAAP